MTTVHDLHSFYVGDDWQIKGSLFDSDGDPLDLTSATIEWSLLNGLQQAVIDVGHIQLDITDPLNGKISILVPSEVTNTIIAGEYNDVLRITVGTITDTMWTGGVIVKQGITA